MCDPLWGTGGGGCYVVGNRDEGGGKEGRAAFLPGECDSAQCAGYHRIPQLCGSFIHQNLVTLHEQNRKHKCVGEKMGKNKRQKKD